jgi:hypothetical protein
MGSVFVIRFGVLLTRSYTNLFSETSNSTAAKSTVLLSLCTARAPARSSMGGSEV